MSKINKYWDVFPIKVFLINEKMGWKEAQDEIAVNKSGFCGVENKL